MTRQPDDAHGGVEGGEQQILGHHLGTSEAVEERRFAGIGVADQGDDGIGHTLAGGAMQATGATDLGQFLFERGDAVVDTAAIELDLPLARATHEAGAAALPLEMGPRADQPRALVGKGRQLDLEDTFTGPRPLAEDLEDQPGAVDDLGVEPPFEIALLDRRERAVDHDEAHLHRLHDGPQLVDLAAGKQRRRAKLTQRRRFCCNHIKVDGSSEADRLLKAHFGRARRTSGLVRMHDERALAVRRRVDRRVVADGRFSPAPPLPRVLLRRLPDRRGARLPMASRWKRHACRPVARDHRGEAADRNCRTN